MYINVHHLMYLKKLLKKKNFYNCALTSNVQNSSQKLSEMLFPCYNPQFGSNKIVHFFKKK